MRGESKARLVNGVVSAAIVLLFLAHALMGGASFIWGFSSPLSVLVWVGVALAAVHVVLSVVTSREQLNDAERPPSPRKKRHLALKWATGLLLAGAAAAHVALPKGPVLGVVLIAVVAVALAVHVCVGSKSLLKDIGVDRRFKTAFRIVVCAVSAGAVLCVIIAVL